MFHDPPHPPYPPKNIVVVLGPTASGKTDLGVALAQHMGGEIISADSRQVYRGLDIGAGKDLDAYVIHGKPVPYHLIDVVSLDREYSVFDFQQACFRKVEDLHTRRRLPILVGGTGLYLESVLQPFPMVRVPENPALRENLSHLSDAELTAHLRSLKPQLHNTTDLETRDRLIRAIEIETHARDHPPPTPPALHPVILGTRWDPDELRRRIRTRLEARMEQGLVREVEELHQSGVSWSRLETLGLEYRFVALFLQGTLPDRNTLLDRLHRAICKFAKRQRTWFRRMERQGYEIHWVDRNRFEHALQIVSRYRFHSLSS